MNTVNYQTRTSTSTRYSMAVSVRITKYVLYVVLGLGAMVMILPIVWMLLSSVKPSSEIIQIPPDFLPVHPTIANFRTVFSEAPVNMWFFNSVLISFVTTAIVLIGSGVAGYTYAKFEFPLKHVSFIILISTMMIPFAVVLIPLYEVVNWLHLTNTRMGVMLAYLVSPFGIFLLKQFAEGIPNTLIDAARVDGCSEWGIYWRIISPQLGPAYVALAIFNFMAVWNDYLWPVVEVNTPNLSTLPLGLSYFNSQHYTSYGLTMTVSAIAVMPVIILFFVLQRWFVEGISMTGIKG